MATSRSRDRAPTAPTVVSGKNYQVLYSGGTNDADNSGELKYVRVEFAGFAPSLNNELNSFTLAAVGSGTKLSYLAGALGSRRRLRVLRWHGGRYVPRFVRVRRRPLRHVRRVPRSPAVLDRVPEHGADAAQRRGLGRLGPRGDRERRLQRHRAAPTASIRRRSPRRSSPTTRSSERVTSRPRAPRAASA